jgi:kynurenine 3-monooxygenase
MPEQQRPPVAIVGSGLAGALMACYLGKSGFPVDLYEKRPDPRAAGAESGRSINLALSVRGLHALGEVGMADDILRDAIAMPGRMIHDHAGHLHFQPYGKDPSKAIHSVSRAGLNMALLDAAERYPSVRIFFEHKCTGIDLPGGPLHFQTASEDDLQVPADLVIGADGAFSAVRTSMQKTERFDYSQEYLSHGYKELTIPPGPEGRFQMEKHALHIWPRTSFMLIALPNLNGSFTCTLFFPFEGKQSFASLQTKADVVQFFEQEFPDALALMPGLVDEFFAHPTGPLVTIRCQPWHQDGRIVLIGDACHAVVPFLGQGMNAAFEDCTVLNRCLVECVSGTDRSACSRAFAAYEEGRKEHTDALADMAVYNFIEMRDHTGSRLFLLKKKWEILLHKLLGNIYIPLYTLVSFTRTPYAHARRRAHRQDQVVRGILLGLLFLAALALILWWR